MTDMLIVRTSRFDDVVNAKAILCKAGFRRVQVEALAVFALAAAKARARP